MTKLLTSATLATLVASAVYASSLEDRVATLESQNETLSEELLALQTAGFTMVDTKQSYSGLGPAASKIYYSKNPLSIGGYGEMYYAKPENKDDFADVYRFITYFGYKFSDSIILNTELEFEHGGADGPDSGKAVIEFMYLDFLWNEKINLRLGNLLVPMGYVNLRHEPILFLTVQRPEVETLLLPSTWQENGAVVYGRFSELGIEYSAGIINALNLNSQETRDANIKWIRNGRQGADYEAPFDPAFVGRLDYTGVNGLLIGASLYYGGASNLKDPDPADPIQDVDGLSATMFDIHFNYENGPFRAYGLYTQTVLDGAEKLSNSAVKEANGYYVNLSYDIAGLLGLQGQLPIFVQYDDFNPVAQTVDGTNTDTYDTQTTTVGMNFFPNGQTVLKMDYAMKTVNGQDNNTFSLGLGFVF